MESFKSNVESGRRSLLAVAAAMLLAGCKSEYGLNELPGEVNANLTQCNDGLDNDGDREIDDFDPDCEDSFDEVEGAESLWEQNAGAQCSNGVDDDGDGYYDLYDEDCYDWVLTGSGEYVYMYLAWDNSESEEGYQPVEE